ncbi:hypothetical protein ONE63_007007 [Megalurothrips usitatus]|uniref:Uncharacterized protein n=1 Tax=Megalurothrips usitatus TaxID=439358 RepID=A0AAV7XU52_9NEOP|nr:hypothetical protein ONE63_007007 [Megalurothrips usitatus]
MDTKIYQVRTFKYCFKDHRIAFPRIHLLSLYFSYEAGLESVQNFRMMMLVKVIMGRDRASAATAAVRYTTLNEVGFGQVLRVLTPFS